MQVDRAAIFTALGGEEAVASMTDEQRADALDDYLIGRLNSPEYAQWIMSGSASMIPVGTDEKNGPPKVRRGAGSIFGDDRFALFELAPMPQRPTLLDFFRLRLALPSVRHLLQSAEDARQMDGSEAEIMACLLHDIGQSLVRVDHGWWTAQMIEPYVSEEIAFAVRYHQALRFFADPSVGYTYPELYNKLFGEDYVPDPYITAAHEYAKSHPSYMLARMVTVHDLYAFDPESKVSLEPFEEIIQRNFRQPEEGLGFDNSPVAHMWRTLIYPDRPL